MKDSAERRHRSGAASWLASRVSDAGAWPYCAAAAGLGAVLAAVVQAYALAAWFQGWVFEHRGFSDLLSWVYWFAGAVVVRAALGWAKEECGVRASALVRSRLREDLVDRIGRLGPAWKARQPSGALASLLVEQIDGVDGYVARFLPQQYLSVLGPLVILAAVFPLNWICGALLLGTAPLIPLFMILVGLGAQAVQTRQLNALSRLSGQFLDSLRGMATLRLLNAHQRHGVVVARSVESFRSRTMEVLRLAFLSSTMLEFFAVLAIALTALYLGFSLLGELNFGIALSFQTALFVLVLAPDFYQPLRELGTHYHARAEALAAAEKLKEVFDVPFFEGGAQAPPQTTPSLSLRAVEFSYIPHVPVLTRFNLTIAAGEAVALTGPSGVGKTTVLRLLQGQIAPTAGEIVVDSTPLATLDLELWRSRIGWLSQHPKLHADTLEENLLVARHDASKRQLGDALEWAGLGPWFSSLPMGLRTRLGEGGRGLSGGQLRRLALARLRLRDAGVLLLDEPTASLDERTQDEVVAALAELTQGRTTVLVTHHAKPLTLVDRKVSLGGSQ